MASARFAAPVSDTTENEFRLTRIPEKTRQITDWGIRAWNEWAAARGASTSEAVTDHVPVATPLLQMTGDDFAYWLGKFVLEVRKADGGEYPPKSLYALVCCFKRYFKAMAFMISTRLIPTILDLEAFAKLSTPRCSDCMLAAWAQKRSRRSLYHQMKKPYCGRVGSLDVTVQKHF